MIISFKECFISLWSCGLRIKVPDYSLSHPLSSPLCLPLLFLVLLSLQEAARWTVHETSLPATRHTSRLPPPEGHRSVTECDHACLVSLVFVLEM